MLLFLQSSDHRQLNALTRLLGCCFFSLLNLLDYGSGTAVSASQGLAYLIFTKGTRKLSNLV